VRRQLGIAAVAIGLIAACTSEPASIAPSGLGPGPSVGTTAVARSAPSASAGSTLPPGWTRTLAPSFDGINTIGRVVGGPAGYVAISDFSAWRSSDGQTWARIQVPVEGPRAMIPSGETSWIAGGWQQLQSATGPTGHALGDVRLAATCAGGGIVGAQFAWSPDGQSWTAAPSDPSFRTYFVGEIAASPDGSGYWSVGSNSCAEGLGATPRSQTWFSTDGRAWTPRLPIVTSGLMIGIAAVGDRLVAVGGHSDDPNLGSAGLAWTLVRGGTAWSAPKPIGDEASPLRQVIVAGATAYAWNAASDPVWSSTDLVTWHSTPMPDDQTVDLAAVTGPSGSWLAAASYSGIYGLSAGGSWVRLAGGSDAIVALGAGPEGLVAIGNTAEGRGVVWQGPLTPP
jgi:hypothetical protein